MRQAVNRAVSVQSDGTRSPVAAARLAELSRRVLAAQRVPRALLSVTMVTARAMASLNPAHPGHRGATDVLTFTPTAPDPPPERARRVRKAHGMRAGRPRHTGQPAPR